MSSQWFRFTTSNGTVYGEVLVPGTPPPWFAPILKKRNEAASRVLDMTDISPEEWVDTICSENRPIPLRKPLSPQPQDELIFFAEGRAEAMMEAARQLAGLDEKGQPDPTAKTKGIPMKVILNDDDFIRKFGKFMEEFENVPPDERKNYRPLPRKQIQPTKARTFVNYIPLLDPDSEEEDVNSYVLYPGQVSGRVTVRQNDRWLRLVHGIWGGLDIASEIPPAPSPIIT